MLYIVYLSSSVVWDCYANVGRKLVPKLNIITRPIANKYREGKLKRTLNRELNSTWNRIEVKLVESKYLAVGIQYRSPSNGCGVHFPTVRHCNPSVWSVVFIPLAGLVFGAALSIIVFGPALVLYWLVNLVVLGNAEPTDQRRTVWHTRAIGLPIYTRSICNALKI